MKTIINGRRILFIVIALVASSAAIRAGKYQNFKVSTYIRAQDVARMEDENLLRQTWETVRSQVDIDRSILRLIVTPSPCLRRP